MISVEVKIKNIPLQTLNIFSTDFIVQHMCHLVCRNLFACGTFVDTRKRVMSRVCYMVISHTQPSSLQLAMEHYQSTVEGMSHSLSGTVAFACDEQFRRYEPTCQQAKTGACVYHIIRNIKKRSIHTLERRDLKSGLRYSADWT